MLVDWLEPCVICTFAVVVQRLVNCHPLRICLHTIHNSLLVMQMVVRGFSFEIRTTLQLLFNFKKFFPTCKVLVTSINCFSLYSNAAHFIVSIVCCKLILSMKSSNFKRLFCNAERFVFVDLYKCRFQIFVAKSKLALKTIKQNNCILELFSKSCQYFPS